MKIFKNIKEDNSLVQKSKVSFLLIFILKKTN